MRAPGFIGRKAEFFQSAVNAAGFTCDADLPSVMNQFVGEADPVILRDDPHQIALNLLR
jgi:hypothetical protein